MFLSNDYYPKAIREEVRQDVGEFLYSYAAAFFDGRAQPPDEEGGQHREEAAAEGCRPGEDYHAVSAAPSGDKSINEKAKPNGYLRGGR